MSRRRVDAGTDAIDKSIDAKADMGEATVAGFADTVLIGPGNIAPSADPGVYRRHRFPAVDAGQPADTAPVSDFALFAVSLEAALAVAAGLPCRITPAGKLASGEAETGSTVYYTSAGGGWLSITLSPTLAEALVCQRCGGTLSGSHGQLSGAASVVRQQAELIALTLRCATESWLSQGDEWTVAATPATRPVSTPAPQCLTVVAGELSCPMIIAVASSAASLTTDAPPAWARDLRRAIERIAFPVRAVLFETRLPLARAAQLRPGDVLPIETPRDVGLRVGTHRLAAGTIAPADDGGHLVTIGARPRLIRPPASEEAPL